MMTPPGCLTRSAVSRSVGLGIPSSLRPSRRALAEELYILWSVDDRLSQVIGRQKLHVVLIRKTGAGRSIKPRKESQECGLTRARWAQYGDTLTAEIFSVGIDT